MITMASMVGLMPLGVAGILAMAAAGRVLASDPQRDIMQSWVLQVAAWWLGQRPSGTSILVGGSVPRSTAPERRRGTPSSPLRIRAY